MSAMENYNFVSDNQDKRGFISKQDILGVVSQEQVFELVFGFQPTEFQYTTSPFRVDTTPGAWFEYKVDGKLLFKDFGNPHKKHYDCFDAVQCYFRLPNFYMTLEFIFNKLIKGMDYSVERRIQAQIDRVQKPQVKILIETRELLLKDADFWWKRYGISRNNLVEDKVFPFVRHHLLNTRTGNHSSLDLDLAYAFTDFPDGRKKLYFPFREKKHRFVSTCRRNDIGGLGSLPPYGRQLIIQKSYKDQRVLRNQGKNVVWFQNEGMIPDLDILVPLCKRFQEVIIWFDNDQQGIEASQGIRDIINAQVPRKSKALWLPENLNPKGISDPADLHYMKGREQLQQFLTQFT